MRARRVVLVRARRYGEPMRAWRVVLVRARRYGEPMRARRVVLVRARRVVLVEAGGDGVDGPAVR